MPTTSESSNDSPQMELAVIQPNESPLALYALRDNAIVIPDDLTKEQWFTGLRVLKRTQENYKLILASYIAYGEVKFGKDTVEDSLHQLEFDLPTVKQCLDINTIPLGIRQPGLTAEHYIVLARAELKDEKARGKWAKTANDQNLSAAQLKVSIEEGEVVTTTVAKQRQHGVITIDGIRQEFEIWLNRMNGVKGILKLEPDTIRDIIKDLAPIASLRDALMQADLSVPQKKTTKPRSKTKPTKSKPKAKAKPAAKSKAKKKK